MSTRVSVATSSCCCPSPDETLVSVLSCSLITACTYSNRLSVCTAQQHYTIYDQQTDSRRNGRTDRRTDGRTSCDSIVRALCTASRDNETFGIVLVQFYYRATLCIARTMLSQDVCPSVRLLHAGIVSKWSYISSYCFTVG